jgi:hypothetical protein
VRYTFLHAECIFPAFFSPQHVCLSSLEKAPFLFLRASNLKESFLLCPLGHQVWQYLHATAGSQKQKCFVSMVQWFHFFSKILGLRGVGTGCYCFLPRWPLHSQMSRSRPLSLGDFQLLWFRRGSRFLAANRSEFLDKVDPWPFLLKIFAGVAGV